MNGDKKPVSLARKRTEKKKKEKEGYPGPKRLQHQRGAERSSRLSKMLRDLD